MSEPAAGSIRVVLADDHIIVRQGLKLLIDSEPDMTVVAEAADGAAAIDRAMSLKPNVVVLDISMPGMNGLLAARTLKKRAPEIAIVTLTRHTDDGYLQELLRSGVSAYVLKQSAARELLHAIRTAASGGQYVDSTLARRLTSSFSGTEGGKSRKTGAITDREADVIRLIARGYICVAQRSWLRQFCSPPFHSSSLPTPQIPRSAPPIPHG